MMQIILVGIGAGATAALLFASVASGSMLATLLFCLAPLPILIAALGWSHWTAIIAAAVAAAGLAAALGVFFAFAFLIGAGLPAWWLGYLALLARPGATPDALEWYPVGRLLLWVAIIATIHVVLAVQNLGSGEESFQTALRTAFERAITTQIPDAANRTDIGRLLDVLVAAIPPAAAVFATVTSALNLWLAARIVKVSGRLKRPWPDLTTASLPWIALALLAGGIAGTMLAGLPAVAAGALTASLLIAYACIGFAVLHTVTRGLANRAFLLAGTYATVIVFGWPVLGVSLLGLANSIFSIRGRLAHRRGPPSVRT